MRKPGSVERAATRLRPAERRSSPRARSRLAVLRLPASHLVQLNHVHLLSGLEKALVLQSLILILMTLPARSCYLNLRSHSRCTAGSVCHSPGSGHSARYPRNPSTHLAPTPGAARADGGQDRCLNLPCTTAFNQFPSYSSSSCPRPQALSPHHLQLNPLLGLAHSPLQGP